MRVALSSLLLILVLSLSQTEGKLRSKKVKHVKAITKSSVKEVDSAKMEDEAGSAVLKLLDAKIGMKVKDAAAEVQRFLTEALGKHIKETTKNMLDKTKHHPKQYKEHAGKAVLVNFKLPYVVTPVHVKKVKPKKKPALKHPKHTHKHKAKLLPQKDVKKHPVVHHAHALPPHHPPHSVPAVHPPAPEPAPMAPPPVTNNADYTDMTPCQGTCTAPCTPGCYAPDCCCCPQAAAPLPPPPPPPPPPAPVAVYYQPPPPPVQAPAPYTPCHPLCSYRCAIFCPKHCCKLSGKRSEISHSMEDGKEVNDSTEAEEEAGQSDHEETGSAEEEDPEMTTTR